MNWLAQYKREWLAGDIVAGVTLAAYAIPVSLAYAGLAGLPPEAGIYGYLLGGLGYALFGSSRQLAIGPTSVAQRHPGWKTKRLTLISSSVTISTMPLGKRRVSSGPANPFRWSLGTPMM